MKEEQIQALQEEYQKMHNGFLTFTEVIELAKLRSQIRNIGKEKYAGSKKKERMIQKLTVVNEKPTYVPVINSTSEDTEVVREVYEISNKINGSSLKNEILLTKITNMKANDYRAALVVAKELKIEGYSKMKKEQLFAAIEDVKKNLSKTAVKKVKKVTAVVKDYQEGQKVLDTKTGLVGVVVKMFNRECRVDFDGKITNKCFGHLQHA